MYTHAFREALSEWITWMCQVLEIQDWRVTLVDGHPDTQTAAASMTCIYGKRHAELRLAEDWLTYTEEQWIDYLTHELCHIVIDPMDSAVHNAGLEDLLGKPAWTVFSNRFTEALENVNDHWAKCVVWMISDFPTHVKLWANVVRASNGELPWPT